MFLNLLERGHRDTQALAAHPRARQRRNQASARGFSLVICQSFPQGCLVSALDISDAPSVGTRRLRRAKPVAREETLSNCEWSWCIAGAGQRRRLSWDTESERNGTGSCFSFTRSGRLQAMVGGAVRQGQASLSSANRRVTSCHFCV